ncbi:MAG: hypothetical protein WC466_09170 [Candidatus Izemoplasmatales bacterium]
MTKDRKEAQVYFIDIKYKHSMNAFEEWYGESVSYSFIEQESYIDLKRMVSEMINDQIKFRKHERNKMVLTLKVEMLNEEFEKFKYLLKEGKIRFVHDYEISNIKKI